MNSFVLLALFASIAYCSPLPDVPPAIAEESPETTFVEEAAFATAESFAQAKALVADKGNGACADLAAATIEEVKQAVAVEQATLNKIATGADCSSEGQTAIDAAKGSLAAAQQAKTDADTALADAKGTKINFGDFVFDSLSPGNCQSMFESAAYTSQKAAVDAATDGASQAAGKVTQAQTAVDDAEAAAKHAVTQCQCNAYKAHKEALEAANTQAEAANKAAWAKGHHLKCVLAGTSPKECTVPPMPKVQAVQLADGVSDKSCRGSTPICPVGANKVSFPVQTGVGPSPQHSSAQLQTTVTGSCHNGYTFTPNVHGTAQAWYRGAFAPMKINRDDLPVTLSWTSSLQPGLNNNAQGTTLFFGLDYLPNNQQNAWYDCQFDFVARMDIGAINEYQQGCKTGNNVVHNQCEGTSGDYEIKVAADGTVTYHKDGTLCITSNARATNFPLYVESSHLGVRTVASKIMLKKD